MIDLDDDAIASALALEHDIDTDLRDPQRSILLAQLASTRKAAIAATRKLFDAPPFDAQAIMLLQNEVRHFRNLATWLRNKQLEAAEIFSNLPPEEQEAVRAFTNPNSEINDA